MRAGYCVIHTNTHEPTIIGRNVTVGHLSLLEGCVIEEGVVVGMGSIVLNRARIGRRTMLAVGSVVREGMEIPAEVPAAGVPAEVKKPLSGSSLEWIEMAAREYQSLRVRYLIRFHGRRGMVGANLVFAPSGRSPPHLGDHKDRPSSIPPSSW